MHRSSEIREQFIAFFRDKHGHTFVPSSPVVPHDDPTLLFTNAGMNQFKDVFLGTGDRDYQRAVNSQKCIRAGGKHNDLEDVGKDTYHHTFFEMLGNWSFGDYFKKDAIAWAWELLTEVWGLDKRRLHATVFAGDAEDNLAADREAAELWRTVTDIDPSHIHRGSKKDNFWEMGDTGPCGPCSEIHYDATADLSGAALVNADDPRVIEIWNLVFIQFNRNSAGLLTPLPASHVDTGMGFERLCAVLQGKTSNYDTDVFTPLFEAIRDVTGAPAYGGSLENRVDMAYRVIADHVRCLTVALTDGAVPSNEGRGYVLRRILRRAVRHGRQTLEMTEPFLHRLVEPVVELMGDAFPELKKNPQRVIELIEDEERSFHRTIDRGIALFEEAATSAIVNACDQMRTYKGKSVAVRSVGSGPLTGQRDESWGVDVVDEETGNSIAEFEIIHGDVPSQREVIERYLESPPAITGEDAFTLYDTYGFPLDLTQVMAEERGMAVDVEGFHKRMEEARERSRGVTGRQDVRATLVERVQQDKLTGTQFVGYEKTELSEQAMSVRVYGRSEHGYEPTARAEDGEHVALVVDRTPFYAEAGGQVGDRGVIEVRSEGTHGRVDVEDTVRVGEVIFHLGRVAAGAVVATDDATVSLSVDASRRARIKAHHTATHMLNRALRDLVNREADQRGSLVDDEKLRFDFSHHAPLGPEQAEAVQEQVNADIEADLPVYADYAPLEQGQRIHGLRAVFGEKYPPAVRIVSIGAPVEKVLENPEDPQWGRYSIEFCGGTHLNRTGEAEAFVLVSEEAVGKGVRRVTALAGEAARQAMGEAKSLQHRAEALKAAPIQDLESKLTQLQRATEGATLPLAARARLRQVVGDLSQRLKEHAKAEGDKAAEAVVERARQIADEQDAELIVTRVEGADAHTLRTAMDVIRKKRPEAAMLLGTVADGKVAFVASVPPGKIERGLKAGDWVREAAKVAGGGGGGRPDMAQAGGKEPDKLDEALEKARSFANSILTG